MKLKQAILDWWPPSWFEICAILLTIGVTTHYLWSNGVTWRTIVFTVAMLVAGFFMGDVARRAWFGY
jgi:hypothetical protein